MKYFSNNYRDSFKVFEDALVSVGYSRTQKMHRADLAFFDHEPRSNPKKYKKFISCSKERPTFIYPHTPYSYLIWDGGIVADKNVCCNFVMGEVGKLCMESFGYPCRVEAIGFDLCFKDANRHHAYEYPKYQPDRFRTDQMFTSYKGFSTQHDWLQGAKWLKSIEPLFERDGLQWIDHSDGLLKVMGLGCANG